MRVFLFRGLAGAIFSTGMNRLSRKLEEAGHTASVHGWAHRKVVQRETIDAVQSGKLTEQIATIGHSLGGNSANCMASKLMGKGIDVSYVGTIDPTEPREKPAGVPLDNFRSRDIRAEKIPGAVDHHFPSLNHIQIDKADAVHKRILEQCELLDDAFANENASDNVPISAETEVSASRDYSGMDVNDLLALLVRRLSQYLRGRYSL
jgi:hypothetical protein